MKLKNLKAEKGFTIIEVLIVLAIAGLIILIVFLAVPALQRNSRNTQYKNQVATYMGAVNEWTNNHNGSIPTGTAQVGEVNALAADGPLQEPANNQTGVRTAAIAIGQMEYVINAKCSTATQGDTIQGSSRSVAIRYSTEDSAGGTVEQCTGS